MQVEVENQAGREAAGMVQDMTGREGMGREKKGHLVLTMPWKLSEISLF